MCKVLGSYARSAKDCAVASGSGKTIVISRLDALCHVAPLLLRIGHTNSAPQTDALWLIGSDKWFMGFRMLMCIVP